MRNSERVERGGVEREQAARAAERRAPERRVQGDEGAGDRQASAYTRCSFYRVVVCICFPFSVGTASPFAAAQARGGACLSARITAAPFATLAAVVTYAHERAARQRVLEYIIRRAGTSATRPSVLPPRSRRTNCRV